MVFAFVKHYLFPGKTGEEQKKNAKRELVSNPGDIREMHVERSKGSGTTPQQRLQGYHDLAKEIIERAVGADESENFDRAIPLYRKAMEVVDEGMRIRAPSAGLGPLADNVVNLKQQLRKWQEDVSARVRALESGGASTSISSPKPTTRPMTRPMATQSAKSLSRTRPQTNRTNPPKLQRRSQPQPGRAGQKNLKGGIASDKFTQIIEAEILVTSPGVNWDDIAGLPLAKQALHESVILPTIRADLFQGLRAPPRGLLLYGPPGNGKTLLAKALASEAQATFFNISASSLTSKWVGDGEKLVRALFKVAAENQPSIIFIDEIDSILSSRSANENDAMRRLKTEFLVQFDGVASGDAHVVVMGATNRPHELDDAARRRLVKRIYIPLPDMDARRAIIKHLFDGQVHKLSGRDVEKVVGGTEGYSGSDLTALCREAAMVPLRELGRNVQSIRADNVRPVVLNDFREALDVIKPSVNTQMLQLYEDFTRDFGTQ